MVEKLRKEGNSIRRGKSKRGKKKTRGKRKKEKSRRKKKKKEEKKKIKLDEGHEGREKTKLLGFNTRTVIRMKSRITGLFLFSFIFHLSVC